MNSSPVRHALLERTILSERDVVEARRAARTTAERLGVTSAVRSRLATAVSEMARNAVLYAGGGTLTVAVEPGRLVVRIEDRGPGIAHLDEILRGDFQSTTGLGAGIQGSRRLVEDFHIESAAGVGTRVELGVAIARDIGERGELAPSGAAEPEAARGGDELLAELEQQSKELLRAHALILERSDELDRNRRELDETNRGVMALYAELDDKAVALQRASELKSRFLSNLSHEFRTPLSSILSLTALLLERVDGELQHEQEKQVKFIRRSAEELLQMVNDLLDLAKVEAGKIDVHPSEFAVQDVFAALRGMLRPLLASDAVALIVEEPIGVAALHTDEGKVSQILRNFVANAIKFTERGEVRVRARPLPGDRVEFSVSDTGIGIAAADFDRIFEEFSQLESPIQRRVKGTGLGLPLSRKLAGLLGGEVNVESELGKGSTFTLTLPRTWRGAANEAPRRTRVDESRRPVLVVEDTAETLRIYERVLQGTGFQLVPARTLGEARQALREFRPAAVVLDIQLDGESGWQLLQELKAADETRGIPVIVVTVLEAAEQARQMGADDFKAKPVDKGWLLEKLKLLAAKGPVQSVLVIDDDEVSRYLLKGHLAKTPYAVLEAEDGTTGLELARLRRPQVIFLDLIMPGMSGFQVLEALKADPATRHIPVIAHTSKVLTPDEEERLRNATIGIVSKRDSGDDKIERVKRALVDMGGAES